MRSSERILNRVQYHQDFNFSPFSGVLVLSKRTSYRDALQFYSQETFCFPITEAVTLLSKMRIRFLLYLLMFSLRFVFKSNDSICFVLLSVQCSPLFPFENSIIMSFINFIFVFIVQLFVLITFSCLTYRYYFVRSFFL